MLLDWTGCEKGELSIQSYHIHLIVNVPPEIIISKLMGVLKGTTAIKKFRSFPHLKKKPYWGNHFWSRGYFVDTVDIDEEKIKNYVKYQKDQASSKNKTGLTFSSFHGSTKFTF